MKISITRTIVLGIILVGGMTACSQSPSTDTPQSNVTPTSTTPTTTPNTSSTTPASTPAKTTISNPSPSATPTQKAQTIRQQIQAVLTPEQAQQLKTKLKQGEKMRPAISTLDLTPEQKTKIEGIFKTARANKKEQSK